MRYDPSRLPIRFDVERLAAFCQKRGIARLSVFGSVVRDDFDPATSDVDVIADFKPGATRGVGFRFFGYDDEWDRQIAADAAAGRLDHLIEEVRADVAAGRCRSLEDVLADESDETGR
jgi:predicted nucleotidyltransferase